MSSVSPPTRADTRRKAADASPSVIVIRALTLLRTRRPQSNVSTPWFHLKGLQQKRERGAISSNQGALDIAVLCWDLGKEEVQV